MYSPQMGQSQSVERSMQRCEVSMEVGMQALHFCEKLVMYSAHGLHGQCNLPGNGKSPSQALALFDICRSRNNDIWAWTGDSPTAYICHNSSTLMAVDMRRSSQMPVGVSSTAYTACISS